MHKQHVIRLTPAQRAALRRLVRRDATSALEQRRARILLASDAGAGLAAPTDLAVAVAVGVDPRTVARVRATFARDGYAVALHRPGPPLSAARQAHERAGGAPEHPGLLLAARGAGALDAAAADGAPGRAGDRAGDQS